MNQTAVKIRNSALLLALLLGAVFSFSYFPAQAQGVTNVPKSSQMNSETPKPARIKSGVPGAARFNPDTYPTLTGTITRVSISNEGYQGNGDSTTPSISADGRYVVFASEADNLVPGDTNKSSDVFVKDLETGKICLISDSPEGLPGNDDSYGPIISADGRYITFESDARNLVPGDMNWRCDVFLYDRKTTRLTCASVNSGGVPANGASCFPTISDDGRYIAFQSDASNLVPGDMNNINDAFVYDRVSGDTIRVSVNSRGDESVGASSNDSACISGDGSLVVFESDAENFSAVEPNGVTSIYLHDCRNGKTTLVSTNSKGRQANMACFTPAISPNGNYTTFYSYATNLLPATVNSTQAVYLRDQETQEVVRMGCACPQGDADGQQFPRMASSTNGRYTVFQAKDQQLPPRDVNRVIDVFEYDRVKNRTNCVSKATDGGAGNGPSTNPAVSATGRYVVFQSKATNLVQGDVNGRSDVFVWDRGW